MEPGWSGPDQRTFSRNDYQETDVNIIQLPVGQLAPEEADCIHIERTAAGKFQLNCSALLSCTAEDDASVAVIGGDLYDSDEEAESAGLAWAADQCVEQLYVSRAA